MEFLIKINMNFNRKQWLKASLIVLSSFITFSCGDKSKNLTEKLNDIVNKASATSEDETKKYNAYIDFNNQFLIPTLDNGIESYLNKAGDQETVKNSEEVFYFNDYDSWDKIADNLKAKPSMKELDTAAEQLIPISKELSGLFVSAKDYYKAKDYLDDKYAKGQELHTKILAGIKKFDIAYEKFELALRNKDIEIRNIELEQAKKQGNEITYNKILVSLSIDKIMNIIAAQKLNATNVLSADLSKIKPLYDEFNKVQKDLREKVQDEAQLKKEGFNDFNKSSLTRYTDKTTEFKTGILDLIERVETKTPVDEFRLQHNFSMDREKGTPENLFRLRDEIISSYNRIR
jgi:hypothetical protein